MNTWARSQPIRAHQQKGITLIELMIAIVLALILAFAVGLVLIASGRVYRHDVTVAEMTQAANVVFETLNFQARHTGYAEITALNPTISFDEITGAAAGGVPFVFGADGCMNLPCGPPDPTRPDMIQFAFQVQGTDVSSSLPRVFDATIGSGGDCNNGNPNDAGALPRWEIAINQFFVRVNPATGIREFVCVGNSNPGVPVAVVENVDDFQVYYGLDRGGIIERIPGRGLSNETLPRVRFVTVCLVLASRDEVLSEPMPRPTCTDDPAVEPTAVPVGSSSDRRVRRSFNYTLHIRNRNQAVNPAPA